MGKYNQFMADTLHITLKGLTPGLIGPSESFSASPDKTKVFGSRVSHYC